MRSRQATGQNLSHRHASRFSAFSPGWEQRQDVFRKIATWLAKNNP